MRIRFHKLHPEATTPMYQTGGSVAFDLASVEEIVLQPGEMALVPTGLVIETPEGFALMLAARSSLFKKKGLMLTNGVGIVDQDYCGQEDEIKITVRNFTNETVKIEKGERLAQGMFVRIECGEFAETDSHVSETSRGGFGSTEGYGKA